MLQTLTGPYLHVQAIRRQLADKGIPTMAKPYYGYGALCNFPVLLSGATATDTAKIDSDAYFVWTSTYYTFTQVQMDFSDTPPEQSSSFNTGAAPFEVKIEMLKTNRRLHSPEFVGLQMFDYWSIQLPAGGDGPDSFDNETENQQTVGPGIQGAWDVWGMRHFFAEPILLEPSEKVAFTVRHRFDVAPSGGGNQGHFFQLCGVKLFPGRV